MNAVDHAFRALDASLRRDDVFARISTIHTSGMVVVVVAVADAVQGFGLSPEGVVAQLDELGVTSEDRAAFTAPYDPTIVRIFFKTSRAIVLRCLRLASTAN